MDFDKEVKRLQNEEKRIAKICLGIKNKLSNKNFTDKAPAEVVKKSKEQLENMQQQLDIIAENLSSML